MKIWILGCFIFGLAQVGVLANDDTPKIDDYICKVRAGQNQGNGFFVENQGKTFIITTSDIVREEAKVKIVTPRGESFALVIYIDRNHGIAILEPLDNTIDDYCAVKLSQRSGRAELRIVKFPEMSLLCKGVNLRSGEKTRLPFSNLEPGTPIFRNGSKEVIGMIQSNNKIPKIVFTNELKSAIDKINIISIK